MYTPVAYTNVQDDVILDRQLPETLRVRAGQPLELVYHYVFTESPNRQEMDLELAGRIGPNQPAPVRLKRTDRWGLFDEESGCMRQVLQVERPGTYDLVVDVKATCRTGPWGAPMKSVTESQEFRCKVIVES